MGDPRQRQSANVRNGNNYKVKMRHERNEEKKKNEITGMEERRLKLKQQNERNVSCTELVHYDTL